jgi:hypothetical protein
MGVPITLGLRKLSNEGEQNILALRVNTENCDRKMLKESVSPQNDLIFSAALSVKGFHEDEISMPTSEHPSH